MQSGTRESEKKFREATNAKVLTGAQRATRKRAAPLLDFFRVWLWVDRLRSSFDYNKGWLSKARVSKASEAHLWRIHSFNLGENDFLV